MRSRFKGTRRSARSSGRRRSFWTILGSVVTVTALVLGTQAATSSADEHYGEGWEDIPEDWTDAHVDWAKGLIERSERDLPQFNDESMLPDLGYFHIGDGNQPGGTRHWINLGMFNDEHILNPNYPESLVFYNTGNGVELVAAMFFLPNGTTMDTIPSLISWLPGWHIHDNLCFDDEGQLTGVAVNGECPDGSGPPVSPPMTHVWIVDNDCGPGLGRFAGIDVGGLQCDYFDHDH